ncbi:MAG: hypothetical protein ACRD2Z_11855 [Thermoanaerobaculia bacterium]
MRPILHTLPSRLTAVLLAVTILLGVATLAALRLATRQPPAADETGVEQVVVQDGTGRLWALAVLLAGAAVAVAGGIALIYRAAQRLRRLSGAMALYEFTDFATPVSLAPDLTGEGDEIARLGSRFERVAQRLEAQRQAAGGVEAARRELLARVAGDLAAPLADLDAYLKTLAVEDAGPSPLPPGARRRQLEVALAHVRRLRRIVTELGPPTDET